jgi:hypothetical protein
MRVRPAGAHSNRRRQRQSAILVLMAY